MAGKQITGGKHGARQHISLDKVCKCKSDPVSCIACFIKNILPRLERIRDVKTINSVVSKYFLWKDDRNTLKPIDIVIEGVTGFLCWTT